MFYTVVLYNSPGRWLLNGFDALLMTKWNWYTPKQLSFWRTFAICCGPSICLSPVLGNSRAPYSGGSNFRQYNISTALGTLAIHWHPLKISRRSSQGNPSAVGVKHKRVAILDLSTAISWNRCNIGGKLLLITNRKLYMSFRLVLKSVILNDLEWHNGRYFALFPLIFVYDVAVKQLLGLPRFHYLLLILYIYIKTICAIIQRLFGQNEVITGFDGVCE